MANPGSAEAPLRVAIVGAGPAGFYAAAHLLKQSDLTIHVDLFDKLPTPFGLVRGGVAPDHQKIKNVTRQYDKTASNENFRFFGNIELGKHVTVEDLRNYYHQICYCTGTQTDRKLGIPGEDLNRSHSATEFVAWYNGHPDYKHLSFDLSQESVAVIGVGNVAVDVARILCRTTQELARTDIADYALEALSNSKVKEVYMLGRRGPSQAAFTNPEVKELGEMEDADTFVLPEEAALDAFSKAILEENPDRQISRKLEIIQSMTDTPVSGKSKKLVIRFLVSPTSLNDDGTGSVGSLTLVKNELYKNEKGVLRPRATDVTETLEAGLVFRSVGYRGVPLPGVPFNDSWHLILNEKGRVLTEDKKTPLTGEYTAGWIKRGPSGVIGTNKADAVETVECMLEDLASGQTRTPVHTSPEAIVNLLKERQPDYFSYADWQKLNEMETKNGEPLGRPRLKFTDIDTMVKKAK
ncbi:MAG: FAD-dependent oxidoreductase [Rhodothermales bacterium]